jgi:hypothetical protein
MNDAGTVSFPDRFADMFICGSDDWTSRELQEAIREFLELAPEPVVPCSSSLLQALLTHGSGCQLLKYCPRAESTLENCGTPTLRFGKALDSCLPF